MKSIAVSIKVLTEGCKNFKKLLDVHADIDTNCTGHSHYLEMETEQEYDEVIEVLRNLADMLNSDKTMLEYRGDK